MPFHADCNVYPDDDSWVGTGMCFFDTEKMASEFYRNILPRVIGTDSASFKRPFHGSDWGNVGAAHKRPSLTHPTEQQQKG